MPAANFDDFMTARETAAEAYVRGDGAKVDSIVPHSGAASFHSPTGDTVTGGDAVAKRYLKDAAAFHDNGASRFDVLQQGDSGDIGFWTGFQIAKVQIGNMPKPVEMRIRVTEIFRRIDGDWKMIHRHADAPKQAQGESHEFLGRAATRIINEVRGINRVVYDITSKPPGTIEWDEGHAVE